MYLYVCVCILMRMCIVCVCVCVCRSDVCRRVGATEEMNAEETAAFKIISNTSGNIIINLEMIGQALVVLAVVVVLVMMMMEKVMCFSVCVENSCLGERMSNRAGKEGATMKNKKKR